MSQHQPHGQQYTHIVRVLCCRVVFYQSADASAQYIHYKYGPDAGAAAQESVPVAKDMLDGKHYIAYWQLAH